MRSAWPASIALVALIAIFLPSPAHAAFVNLTGTVKDQNGGGIFGVVVNFVDSCTGVTAAAAGNTTSVTGSFTATVNSGIYDVEFSPPPGSLFTASRLKSFDLTVSRVLAPITLPNGITVSGRVTDGAVGVLDVYLRFYPPGVSERVFAVRDRTDASGNYSVVVAPGTYDLRYGPPLGTRFLAASRLSVTIAGSTTLPTVALTTGLLVGGTVRDLVSGTPAQNVNIDVVATATGADVDLSHDRSAADGSYSVAVPPGTYTIEYKPEKCPLNATHLVPQAPPAVTIAADQTLPLVSLERGVLLNGTVTDTRGAPVFDVNTNYFSGGLQVFTSDDHTDAAGACSVVVPPGLYNIDYLQPVGLRLAGVKVSGITVPALPTTMILPAVQLPDGFFVTGRAITVVSAPVAGVNLDVFPPGSAARLFTPHDGTDAAGNFQLVLVPGTYDIRMTPPTTALAARRFEVVSVSTDVTLGDIVLEQGHVVTGHVSDDLGAPVCNVDLDFYDFYTGEKVETPGDNTNDLGDYSVVVPPRLYKVNFVPPVTQGLCLALPRGDLDTAQIPGVTITANLTGLNTVLRGAARVRGRVINTLAQVVANVDLNFFDATTGLRQIVSRDNTAADGRYEMFVPFGTYDIVFAPPATLALAPVRLGGVSIPRDVQLPDVVLTGSLNASITSIAPATGPSDGGTAVTMAGTNFQFGAAVTLGGLALLNVQYASATQITGVAPGCPLGAAGAAVDLAVTNVGGATAVKPSAFTYTPAPTPVNVSLARIAPSVLLSWISTGQAFYTIYRGRASHPFGQAQLLAIVSSTTTTFTDVGADADGVNYFYKVE
jgi:hypothetical protein